MVLALPVLPAHRGRCWTTQQVGMAIGMAVLSTFAATWTSNLLAAGSTQAAALTGGYRLAFGIVAGLLVLSIVVVVLILRPPAIEPSAKPASETLPAR